MGRLVLNLIASVDVDDDTLEEEESDCGGERVETNGSEMNEETTGEERRGWEGGVEERGIGGVRETCGGDRGGVETTEEEL